MVQNFWRYLGYFESYWPVLVFNLLNDGLYFIALLALARAIAGREEASDENAGPEKELLPDGLKQEGV